MTDLHKNAVRIHQDTYSAAINAAINPTSNSRGGTFTESCQVTFLNDIKKPGEFSTTSLASVLGDIKNGKYRNLIEALPPAESDAYKEAKRKLPSIAFNGTFEGSVKNENLACSSGLFHFDIDKLTAEELASVKAKLVALPEMVFVFLSPSRNGLKGG